jgi:hypothetical protein
MLGFRYGCVFAVGPAGPAFPNVLVGKGVWCHVGFDRSNRATRLSTCLLKDAGNCGLKRIYLSQKIGVLWRVIIKRDAVGLRVVDRIGRRSDIRDGLKNAHVRVDGRVVNAGRRERLKPCAVS